MGSPSLRLPHPIYEEILFVLSLKYIHMLYFHHPHTMLSNDHLSRSLLQQPLTGLPASLSPPAICYSLSSLTDASIHKPYHIATQFKILRSLLLSSIVKLKTIPQPTWFGFCSDFIFNLLPSF